MTRAGVVTAAEILADMIASGIPDHGEPPPTQPTILICQGYTGTLTGYRAHIELEHEPCPPCLDAHTKNSKRKFPPRERAKCGTPGGYERHRLDREEACLPCKVAHAEKKQKYRARKAAGGAS